MKTFLPAFSTLEWLRRWGSETSDMYNTHGKQSWHSEYIRTSAISIRKWAIMSMGIIENIKHKWPINWRKNNLICHQRSADKAIMNYHFIILHLPVWQKTVSLMISSTNGDKEQQKHSFLAGEEYIRTSLKNLFTF